MSNPKGNEQLGRAGSSAQGEPKGQPDGEHRASGQDLGCRGPCRRGWKKGFSLAGAIAALLVGASALWSSLASAHGGWGGFGRHRGPFPQDPEVAREHASFAASWMLQRVDADDAQQERVQALVGEAVTDLFALGRQHRENRGLFLELLSQPEVDRAALEELRQEEIRLADQASRRLLETLVDVAEVLTPEQRAELAELAQHFGPRK